GRARRRSLLRRSGSRTSSLLLASLSTLRRTAAPEIDSATEERQGPRLVEHVVEVAALRALVARGAAVGARTAGEQTRSVRCPTLELLETSLRDADAAGVAVVDEHGRPAGLRVHVGRQPPDVPAVAHRPERQQRDQSVLGRVERAQELRHLLEADQLVRLRQEPG